MKQKNSELCSATILTHLDLTRQVHLNLFQWTISSEVKACSLTELLSYSLFDSAGVKLK